MGWLVFSVVPAPAPPRASPARIAALARAPLRSAKGAGFTVVECYRVRLVERMARVPHGLRMGLWMFGVHHPAPGIPRSQRFAGSRPLTLCEGGVC